MRHRFPTAATAGLAATLALCAAPSAAQEPLADPAIAGVRLELAALNETLQRIEGLLQRHLDGQKLELVLQRIEVTSTRIGQLERELENLRGESSGIDEERSHASLRLEEAETALAAADSAEQAQQVRAFIAQDELHLGRLRERERDIENRIPLLEDRLGALRRDLEDWQAYFDREVVEE